MSIGLLITTCKNYFSNIPNIIENIEDCNFPKENILIVSGQEDENSTYYENNIRIVKVDYTGLHLTGLIYLSENIGLFKNINYWIILPDTIKIGKLFYTKLMKYYDMYLKNNKIYCLPLIKPILRPTMDIGIVSIYHIYNMLDYLKKIKLLKPYNMDDILKFKKQLIYDENTVLGLEPVLKSKSTKFKIGNPLYPKPNIFITNNKNNLIEKKITINNKLVNEVYIELLDLYKYQRNFNGIYSPFIMEL